jgi:hypothetical protein
MQPIGGDFFLYGMSRGSVMVGTSNRTSTQAVVVPGNAAVTTASKLTDNKTLLAPVGEFEFGVAWGQALSRRPLDPTRDVVPAAPILWVKAGVVVDIWGGMGILSAQDNAQGYSGGSLLLYGFSVLAGLDY